MKFLVLLGSLMLLPSAYAGCCSGSCWRDGCCPPKYGCEAESEKKVHVTCFPEMSEDDKSVIEGSSLIIFSESTKDNLTCIEEVE